MTRQLPFLERMSLFINGSYGLIALFLLLFGLMFIFLTINEVDFAEIEYLRDEVSEGTGLVTNVFETGTTTNEVTVYGYDYIFFSSVGDLEWTSYNIGNIYEIGDTLDIEFSSFSPDVNRIKGMDNTPVGIFSILFILPFLVGFIWTTINIFRGVKKYRLLKIGVFTKVKFIRKETTPFSVNDRRVHKYLFTFMDNNGKEYYLNSNTSNYEKFEPIEEVMAVYDPLNSNHAFIVNSLPTGIPYIKKIGANTHAKNTAVLSLFVSNNRVTYSFLITEKN